MISDFERRVRRLIERASAGDAGIAALSGYEIEQRLGAGGMGEVYRARRPGDHERVALKVMLPEIALDEQAQVGFLREISNIRSLQHPNIVEYRDAGAAEGTLFLVMEFCRGGSIDQLMNQRGGVLAPDEAVPIVLQALEGLAYAHEATLSDVRLADGRLTQARGLVHRDIKPQNILLAREDTHNAKIGDFGLAKAFDTAGLSGQTHTGMAAGTLQFMPRSQVVNFKYAGPEVDVWAMAASLYYMLTAASPRDFPPGRDPFAGILNTEPISIHQRGVPVPKRLGDVVDAALAEGPAAAITSARELINELQSA